MSVERIPPHHDPTCWGCGENLTGLRLPLPESEGIEEYEAYTHFDERHQAGPGIAHGGSWRRSTRRAGCLRRGTGFPP
jgi:hypothetical protein